MKKKVCFGPILLTLLFLLCEKSYSQYWLWEKSLSATNNIYGVSVAVDPEGNGDVYISGGFEGNVDFDPGPGTYYLSSLNNDVGIFISKFDKDGNLLWAKAMVGPNGNGFGGSIVFDPGASGDFYITGLFWGIIDFDPGPTAFNLTSAGNEDIFISKLDNSGHLLWAKAIGNTGTDKGSSLTVDPSGRGDVYTTGKFTGTVDFDPGDSIIYLKSGGPYKAFISKLDNGGNFVWAKTMEGTGYSEGYAITIDPLGKGDVYITGLFSGKVDFDPGPDSFNLTSVGLEDIFISKLDSLGNFVWAKAMGGTNNEVGRSIAIDPTGHWVYITGHFIGSVDLDPSPNTYPVTSRGNRDIFVSKLDYTGNFLWSKSIGSIALDEGISIAIDPGGNGNIYTTGSFSDTTDFDPGPSSFKLTSEGSLDVYISNLDSAGNFVWVKSMSGTGNDYASDIAFDGPDFILATGFFKSPSFSFDSVSLTNVNPTGADLFFAKLRNTVSIITIDSKLYQLTLYPNPATYELTIEFAGDEFFGVDISMFNILGEMVYNSPDENIGHKKTIDISTLCPGIYFIVLDIDGNRVVEKVVKE